MKVDIKHNNKVITIEVPDDCTLQELKAAIAKETNVPPAMQKLMGKPNLKKDEEKVSSQGVSNGAKLMMIGSPVKEVVATNTSWSEPKKMERKQKASCALPFDEYLPMLASMLKSEGEKDAVAAAKGAVNHAGGAAVPDNSNNIHTTMKVVDDPCDDDDDDAPIRDDNDHERFLLQRAKERLREAEEADERRRKRKQELEAKKAAEEEARKKAAEEAAGDDNSSHHHAAQQQQRHRPPNIAIAKPYGSPSERITVVVAGVPQPLPPIDDLNVSEDGSRIHMASRTISGTNNSSKKKNSNNNNNNNDNDDITNATTKAVSVGSRSGSHEEDDDNVVPTTIDDSNEITLLDDDHSSSTSSDDDDDDKSPKPINLIGTAANNNSKDTNAYHAMLLMEGVLGRINQYETNLQDVVLSGMGSDDLDHPLLRFADLRNRQLSMLNSRATSRSGSADTSQSSASDMAPPAPQLPIQQQKEAAAKEASKDRARLSKAHKILRRSLDFAQEGANAETHMEIKTMASALVKELSLLREGEWFIVPSGWVGQHSSSIVYLLIGRNRKEDEADNFAGLYNNNNLSAAAGGGGGASPMPSVSASMVMSPTAAGGASVSSVTSNTAGGGGLLGNKKKIATAASNEPSYSLAIAAGDAHIARELRWLGTHNNHAIKTVLTRHVGVVPNASTSGAVVNDISSFADPLLLSSASAPPPIAPSKFEGAERDEASDAPLAFPPGPHHQQSNRNSRRNSRRNSFFGSKKQQQQQPSSAADQQQQQARRGPTSAPVKLSAVKDVVHERQDSSATASQCQHHDPSSPCFNAMASAESSSSLPFMSGGGGGGMRGGSPTPPASMMMGGGGLPSLGTAATSRGHDNTTSNKENNKEQLSSLLPLTDNHHHHHHSDNDDAQGSNNNNCFHRYVAHVPYLRRERVLDDTFWSLLLPLWMISNNPQALLPSYCRGEILFDVLLPWLADAIPPPPSADKAAGANGASHAASSPLPTPPVSANYKDNNNTSSSPAAALEKRFRDEQRLYCPLAAQHLPFLLPRDLSALYIAVEPYLEHRPAQKGSLLTQWYMLCEAEREERERVKKEEAEAMVEERRLHHKDEGGGGGGGGNNTPRQPTNGVNTGYSPTPKRHRCEGNSGVPLDGTIGSLGGDVNGCGSNDESDEHAQQQQQSAHAASSPQKASSRRIQQQQLRGKANAIAEQHRLEYERRERQEAEEWRKIQKRMLMRSPIDSFGDGMDEAATDDEVDDGVERLDENGKPIRRRRGGAGAQKKTMNAGAGDAPLPMDALDHITTNEYYSPGSPLLNRHKRSYFASPKTNNYFAKNFSNNPHHGGATKALLECLHFLLEMLGMSPARDDDTIRQVKFVVKYEHFVKAAEDLQLAAKKHMPSVLDQLSSPIPPALQMTAYTSPPASPNTMVLSSGGESSSAAASPIPSAVGGGITAEAALPPALQPAAAARQQSDVLHHSFGSATLVATEVGHASAQTSSQPTLLQPNRLSKLAHGIDQLKGTGINGDTHLPTLADLLAAMGPRDRLKTASGVLLTPEQFTHSCRVVVVYFTASWSEPCKRIAPMVTEAYNKLKERVPHADKKLEFLLISCDRTRESHEKYVEQFPFPRMTWPDESILRPFDLKEIPQILVFAPNGQVMTQDGVDALLEDPEALRFPHAPWNGAKPLSRSDLHILEFASSALQQSALQRFHEQLLSKEQLLSIQSVIEAVQEVAHAMPHRRD